MKNIKQRLTIENALCLYIVLCPVLDMISFIFRNAFNTNISPSTFVRPIISISVALAIFIKCKFKRKNINSWISIRTLWRYTLNIISKLIDRDVI